MTADALHTSLASALLYGLNMAYEAVDETHMRTVRFPNGDGFVEVWEVEVCCHGLGFTISLRDDCALDAALAVAAKIIDLLEVENGEVVN